MWDFKGVLTYVQQKERMKSEKEKKKIFSDHSHVLSFHCHGSFGHFGLLLSPQDLTCSHHQPFYKTSITVGFTEESFNLTFQIITGVPIACCHQ